MYLILQEFTELTGEEMEGKEFRKLLPRAEGVLNMITDYFYLKNDLETDTPFRANQFKLALSAQILHFKETGTSTTAQINAVPTSWSIGRTSISGGGGKSSERGDSDVSMGGVIPNEVYMYLNGTGLLYRGVGGNV